jgi:hypothetical protein
LSPPTGKRFTTPRAILAPRGSTPCHLQGGEENHVLTDEVVRRSFDVVLDGIYYITPRDENLCEIRFHEFANGRKRVIGDIERPVAFGLSVSPDHKTFLFSKPVTGSDLMLIENFR